MQKIYISKNEVVDRIYNLVEMLGEVAILQEWIIYSSNEELKEFIEHCEEIFEVESII